MGRLTTSGFEFQVIDTVANHRAEERGYRNVGAPTIDTTVKRSGAASLKTSNPAAPAYARFLTGGVPVVDRDYYARGYFRLSDNTPAVNLSILRAESGAGGRVAEVRITTAGAVRLIDSANAQIGSDGAALAVDVWHRVELRYRVNGTTGTAGNAELRITEDAPGATSVVVASSVGAANLGTAAPIRLHAGNVIGNSPGVDLWVDDVALNDDQDSDENSYPGPGKIVLLKPTSDHQVNGGWKNGANGTTDLWDALDARPPAGVVLASATATSQIRNAGVAGAENYYANLESYSTGGLVSTDRIKVVQAVAAVGSSTTTDLGAWLQLDANPSGSSGGTSTGTTAAGTYPTGWVAFRSLVAYAPSVTLGTAVRVRLEKSDLLADELMVCLLGVYVEYNPAVNVDVDAASITVAGLAPSVSISAAAATGDVPVTGQAPSPGVVQDATTGAVAVEGLAAGPSVSVAAPAADVTVAGQVPSASISDTEDVTVADIAVTGQAPSPSVTSEPPAGALTVSGEAPGVGVEIAASTAQIAVEGQVPTLGGDASVSVDTAAITVEGLAPTITASQPAPADTGGGWVTTRRRTLRRDAEVFADPGYIYVQGLGPAVGVENPVHVAARADAGRVVVEGLPPALGVAVSISGLPSPPDTELEDLELLLLS